MEINKKYLERWKNNSLKLAIKIGLNKDTISFIENNVKLKLIKRLPPSGNWYGWCIYDEKKPVIVVYSRNLSTESISTITLALKQKKIPQELIDKIIKIYNQVGKMNFFEIYNQSGMDHEIIGHLYNFLEKQKHGEKAAVNIQLLFAKKRSGNFSGKNWKRVLEIMPIVLGYHKGIDELKN